MQTFLPFPLLARSAKVLDMKRLGKQRVEAFQILNILIKKYKVRNSEYIPWQNHPAVLMWIGHQTFLAEYIRQICLEWKHRGYKDTILDKTDLFINDNMEYFHINVAPYWIGDPDLHASHRSNLLRKDPEWYGKFGWVEPNNLEYWWPSKQLEYFDELLKENGWK